MKRRLALVTFAALAITACNNPVKPAVEGGTEIQTSQQTSQRTNQQTNQQTSQKGDTVSIKSQDGSTVNISSQMPDDLKNFPVPAGFKPDSSGSVTSGNSGGDKLAVTTWKGTASLDSVTEFYKKTMPSQGWTEASVVSTDSGAVFSYSKGDQSALTITTGKDGNSVTISVLLTRSGPTPTAAPPKTANASALPDEMKILPVPDGFSIVDGSAGRVTDGGKFTNADARWFGKTDYKKVADYYRRELKSRGWIEKDGADSDGEVDTHFTNDKAQLDLSLSVTKTDAGTEVAAHLGKIAQNQ